MAKMMKILFPLDIFYPSQSGGPANTVYWITKNLLKFDLEPVVVSTDAGVAPDVARNKWTTTDGVRAIYIKTYSRYFPCGQLLASFLNFYTADIIHTSSLFSPSAFPVAFVSRIFGKKMVMSVHGELHPHALTHSAGRKRIMLRLIKTIIGRYPTYHSTSDEETSYIKAVFGDGAKIAQVPNYLEIPERSERTPENYLLFIGRIHPIKAVDELLRALSMSPKFLRSDFYLKIAGNGENEYETELRSLIDSLGLTQKVRFVGQVEGEEKQRLLSNAHFMILPSHTENFGVVVLESLAQSTPVIASKGTPWKSLEDEQIGFWTDNSPEALSEVIEKVLHMRPDEYERYRSRCRPFVESEFDIGKNIDKWVKLYESL